MAALHRAESRGDPRAASSLASVPHRRRDPDHAGAEAAYRRAAALGYGEPAWSHLALFLEEERGDLAGTQAARQAAVAAGEDRAEWLLDRYPGRRP